MSPKCAVGLGLRVSFGLALLFVGIDHYLNFAAFSGMTAGGMGSLAPLGTVWAYALPALQIVGGASIALGVKPEVGYPAASLALTSIAVGMTLKPLLGDGACLAGCDMATMGAAQNALIWLFILALVAKMGCCGGGSCDK